ncbi:MAG: hypothetical protein R3F30_09810 [Planctomycetota bacterium]
MTCPDLWRDALRVSIRAYRSSLRRRLLRARAGGCCAELDAEIALCELRLRRARRGLVQSLRAMAAGGVGLTG